MSTRTKLVLDAVTHSQPTMCAEKIGTIFFEGGSIQVLDILDIKPMADVLVNISSFVDITRHLFNTTFCSWGRTFSAHVRLSQVTLQHRILYISVFYIFALEHKQSRVSSTGPLTDSVYAAGTRAASTLRPIASDLGQTRDELRGSDVIDDYWVDFPPRRGRAPRQGRVPRRARAPPR